MQAQRKIAVAGATGRVGRHVVAILEEHGHEVVPIARSLGVDLITTEGLADALEGVESVVDAANAPSARQQPATKFSTTAARNLQQLGSEAGVERIVVVSVIGNDRARAGYGVAKQAHERASLTGPVPARILRAAQFHELVAQLLEWGGRDGVVPVPKTRTQLVAARSVAGHLAHLALAPEPPTGAESDPAPISEIAGPREENLAEMARLYVSHYGDLAEVSEVVDPDDPDSRVYEDGGLLPGPDATLAGPTFDEWLERSR
jgi:uncharacterized protein YbjT (DUF2867 family)